MSDIVKSLMDKWQHSEELCYDAAKRILILEAALRFYLDPGQYTDCYGEDVQVPDFYSELDFGETARRALKGEEV